MNKEFELKVSNLFFNKKSRDRIFYELSSKKKRSNFFDKISHTAEWYLDDCVYKKFNFIPNINDIAEYLNDNRCYFITLFSEYDGDFFDTVDILDKIWSNGSAYMVINCDCTKAYLETEYDYSSHNTYFLRKK